MVRIVVPIGQSMTRADARGLAFAGDLSPLIAVVLR